MEYTTGHHVDGAECTTVYTMDLWVGSWYIPWYMVFPWVAPRNIPCMWSTMWLGPLFLRSLPFFFFLLPSGSSDPESHIKGRLSSLLPTRRALVPCVFIARDFLQPFLTSSSLAELFVPSTDRRKVCYLQQYHRLGTVVRYLNPAA